LGEFANIDKGTLSRQVHTHLRQQILLGELKQGAHLSETGISAELGVSATPVREALRLLHGEGLVEINGRRGARVIAPTQDEIRHAFEVRRVLERLALREACRNFTSEDRDHLVALAEKAVEEGARTSQWLFEVDREFHGFVLKKSGNSWLSSFLDTLSDFLLVVRQPIFKSANSLNAQNTQLEHLAIAKAAQAGRIEEAEHLLDRHIDRVCNDVLRSKEAQDQTTDSARGSAE
jgi:DNA-binding GntR family transcriptional regulator